LRWFCGGQFRIPVPLSAFLPATDLPASPGRGLH
jgi:hypothetical protein